MRKILLLFALMLVGVGLASAETWTPVGQAEWYEGIVNVLLSKFNGAHWHVTIERSDENANLLRMQPYINHPVDGGKNVNGYSAIQKDDVYVYIDISDNNKVFIKSFTYHYMVDPYNNHRLNISQRVPENGYNTNYYGKIEGYTIEFIPGSFISVAPHWYNDPSYISNSYHKIVLNNDILGFTPPTEDFDNPLAEDNGVFMGIIGFNDELTAKPISLLNKDTKADFTSFVDDLQMGNATLLYYAVDQAIDKMKAQSFPDNLSNAVLITFTDGLDQGSLAMKPEYRTSRCYATYLADKIAATKIQNHPLEAYAIGLKSSDVYDNELFMYNLQSLASTDANISPVSNITEMQQKLSSLFDNLERQTSQRIVQIKVPMMSHGDKYRFTLDHSSDKAENSNIWIEGEFNIDNMSLENVSYNGLTSTSGSTIKGSQDGIKLLFTLMDCRTPEGDMLDVDKDGIDQWQYIASRGVWNHNKENAKAEDIDIQNIKSSVAIMFALDCSTSLDELFPMVKTTANSFISRLAGEDESTGVDTIVIENVDRLSIDDPDVEIYNLQGIRVENPSNGLYILRKGETTQKLLVK